MNVLQFPKKPNLHRKEERDEFSCLKCESKLFSLTSEGWIFCGGCGAYMSNLSVRLEQK